MNFDFGKLVEGELQYAPDFLDTPYGRIESPTETNYLFYGWKKIVRGANVGEELGYAEDNDSIYFNYFNTNYGKLNEFGYLEYPLMYIRVDDLYWNLEPTAEDYLRLGFKKLVDTQYSNEYLEFGDSIYGVWNNSNYGKLVDGELEFAKDKYVINDELVTDPTAEQYLSLGFKEIQTMYLPEREGYDIVFDKFIESETAIAKTYVYKMQIREFSKLKIVVATKAIKLTVDNVETNLFELLKKWIQDNGLYDEYLACINFKSDNEYFLRGLQEIKAAIPSLTDEVIDDILNHSVMTI